MLVGALVFAPAPAIAGALAALLATLLVSLMGVDRVTATSGAMGYNALLVGAGAGALFAPSPQLAVLLVLATLATTLISAAARTTLGGTLGLPMLTVPFLVVFPLLSAAAPLFGVPWLPPAPAHTGSVFDPSVALECLGAIYFIPRADFGAVVLAALVLHSRVAVVLVAVGLLAAGSVLSALAVLPHEGLPAMVGYNGILVAIAVGGVWFVPSRSSLVLAFLCAAGSTFFAIAVGPYAYRWGVPVLALPFNLTVLLTLLAMRQRARDSRPAATATLAGSPEASATASSTFNARFGARYGVRFSAPFLGRWTCTQGIDGEVTHQGLWRHAFDFEVLGSDGRPFGGEGAELEDYRCYRLPVLAPADGTVVKVVNNVPDNAPGETNLEANWGNVVVLMHGVGLYSLVAHLSPGSVAVFPGQFVRRGDLVGLCGSSGRSPRPHLHLQLQGSPVVGAPTLPIELHDVVLGGDGADRLQPIAVPRVGDRVRNLEVRDAALLGFEYGVPQRFAVVHNGRSLGTASLVPDLDLWGNRFLRSEDGSRVLPYEVGVALLAVFEPSAPGRLLGGASQGADGAALACLRLALGRTPLELDTGLVWSDRVSWRSLAAPWARPLIDLVAPFVDVEGAGIRYASCVEGGDVIITGEVLDRSGARLLETRLRLAGGDVRRGVLDVEVRRGAQVTRLSREGEGAEAPRSRGPDVQPVPLAASETTHDNTGLYGGI